MIIAVDFDGTLQINGQPNLPLIYRLRKAQRRGDIVILWTCRTGKALRDAASVCFTYGLRFNFINENPPEVVSRLGYNPRKIFADVYIDDKARGIV